MNPVWTLFSRRTLSRLRYWLSALGYDLHDRSVSNRIYLIYFLAFWMVWAIAVFTLLGSGVAAVFNEIQGYSPPLVVVTLAEYLFILWALVLFWQVSRRSPFVFTEEDAYLLCQTPVDRRKVGLVWFLQGTMRAIIPFAAITVILSFALVEWRLQGDLTILQIFEYLKFSLLALILVIPMQIGWQAALWGLGALRLHHPVELAWPRLVFIGALLLLLAGFFFSGLHNLIVAPVSNSFQAAFLGNASTPDLIGGIGLGFFYLFVGLGFLTIQSRKINLSRAAQETSQIAKISLARSYGQFDLVDSILLRKRLGAAHPPSRLLSYPAGKKILFWKDLLQSLRTFRLRDIFNLIWIFGLSLWMFGASNWAMQMLIAGVWTISIGGLTTQRLRSDLARWWLLRSLPLRPEELLKHDLVLSWGICTLVSWLALASSNPMLAFGFFAAVLAPILVANSALATAHDILRHSTARILMSPSLAEENVPRQNIWGVLQALISVLVPFGILVLSSSYREQPIWGLGAFTLAAFITWLNRRALLGAYRWME